MLWWWKLYPVVRLGHIRTRHDNFGFLACVLGGQVWVVDSIFAIQREGHVCTGEVRVCKASPRHDRGRGHQRLYTATAENRVTRGDQTRSGGDGSGDCSCCGRNRWGRMREALGGNGSSNCSSSSGSSSSGIGVDVACQRGRGIASTAIRHPKQGGSKRWDSRHLSTAGDGSGSGGSVIGSVGNEGGDGGQVMV